MKNNLIILNVILTIIIVILFSINNSCTKKDPAIHQQTSPSNNTKENLDKLTYRVDVPQLILRNEPNIKSKIVTTLKQGAIVNFIQKTEFIDTFDQITAPWFQVKTSDDQTGFIFSGYLIKNTKEIENLLITQKWLEKYEIYNPKPRKNLRELVNITIIYVGSKGSKDSQMKDITPIQYLTNLKELNLGGNANPDPVSDLTPLKHLKNLEKLGIFNTKISDITPLKYLKNLKFLSIGYSPITDLTPLKTLPKLQTLQIIDIKDISNFKGLIELKSLKSLSLGNILGGGSGLLSDIHLLKYMTNLRELVLGGSRVSDITPLKSLIKLQSLNLSFTKVLDLRPLKTLTRLEEINLTKTQVSNLNPLKSLINLKSLWLPDTKVSDITPLKSLSQLIDLNLGGTRVPKEQVEELKKILPKCKINY